MPFQYARQARGLNRKKQKRAALYVRVSTGEQHTQAQERALREYVQRRKALARIPELRDEFWHKVRVVGTGEELNQSLEKANRVRAHRLLLRGRDEERTRACNT